MFQTSSDLKIFSEFKTLSDSELVSKTKSLASEERRLLALVLLHLEEIERRGIHLALGFSSLFSFCLEELGYTAHEAHARISVMRLSREMPEVVQAVESGRASLTNLAQAQTYFRTEKQAGKPVSVESKRELLHEIEGMSTRECKTLFSPQSVLKKTFELDDALGADLRRIRELWGNQDLSDTELLRKMAKLVLSRIDPDAKAERKKVRAERAEAKEKESEVKKSVRAPEVEPTQKVFKPSPRVESSLGGGRGGVGVGVEPNAGAEVILKEREETPGDFWGDFLGPLPEVPVHLITPDSRPIPAKVKAEVWERDGGRCTFAHHGRRCTSRYALQFDHLDPYAYGGAHTMDNLRLLCRAHHRSISSEHIIGIRAAWREMVAGELVRGASLRDGAGSEAFRG